MPPADPTSPSYEPACRIAALLDAIVASDAFVADIAVLLLARFDAAKADRGGRPSGAVLH